MLARVSMNLLHFNEKRYYLHYDSSPAWIASVHGNTSTLAIQAGIIMQTRFITPQVI
jgi:hypothetical protein